MEIPSTLFLIGFMASGKSTTGKRLAKLLGYNFLDLDQLISQEEKLSIPEIFEEKGESYFRELEQSCLKAINLNNNTLVACGGGTPCFFDNMDYMNANGLSIYLKASPRLICHRLLQASQKKQRPLVQAYENREEELLSFVTQKLDSRQKFYQSAHLTFPIDGVAASQLHLELFETISTTKRT